MRDLSYYRCSDSEVLNQALKRDKEIDILKERGSIFAKHFGGKLLVQNDIHSFKIVGLSFETPKDTTLWTKPEPKQHNFQRPREKVHKTLKDESAKLKAEFDLHFPKENVSLKPLLIAIGTSWGNLIFGGRFEIFFTKEAVYVATNSKLNDLCKEILASEFSLAAKELDPSPL